MPLFYQHTINETTHLAVWHIKEPEEFFTEKVFLKNHFKHPHKRLQHLAGRYLLYILQKDFPFESILLQGKKPVLACNSYHFSISHCGDFAAAILSKEHPVGIDIEHISPKVASVQHKFINNTERQMVDATADPLRRLTLIWSAKETMFKWYGKGSVDFKKHLNIQSIFGDEGMGMIQAQIMKEEIKNLNIEYQFFKSLCLSYTVNE